MALSFYIDESFTSGSTLDPVDTFTGNGSTTTFTLTQKSAQRLSSTIQAGSSQYYQYNGGFTKNTGTNTFTLSTPPGINTQIVAPGISQIVCPVFDQNVVTGVTNPRVYETPVWFGDGSTIQNFSYSNLPTLAGIEISLVDLVSSVGAQTSWCQLAPANVNGTVGTYGAAGAALLTSPLTAFGTTLASSVASSNAIFCATASTFIAGDYIVINIGTASQEYRKVTVINNTTGQMTLSTNLDFGHAAGEAVFTCGRKFYLKVTIPTNAASNTATNFYDLALRRRGRIISRV